MYYAPDTATLPPYESPITLPSGREFAALRTRFYCVPVALAYSNFVLLCLFYLEFAQSVRIRLLVREMA